MHVSLYTGHHKVGSTSLQIFLSQNVVRLIRHGILYPYTEAQGAASVAARMLKGDRSGVLPVNIREPHSALAYKLMNDATDFVVPPQFASLPDLGQMIRAITMQVAEFKPNSVVLCSEAFANFGAVKPELVDMVTEIFPKADFSVYTALRRPDEYLASWHNQRIKVCEKVDALTGDAWRQYEHTIHMDFRLAVEDWLIRVPGKHKVLRNYSDILASGGSEADYMARSGISFPTDLVPAKRANKSLHPALVEIARLANHTLARPDAHALVQFLLKVDARLDLPAPKEVEFFGARARADLHAAFLPVHAWLSVVSGKEAFFPDIDDVLVCRPVTQSEATRLALEQLHGEAMAGLSSRLHEFIAHLRTTYKPIEV
ncbi:MAG: hypothetical protein ACK41U_17040 [Paracoccus sp. (in: a-proteobacteria)]|uniref:hypothetical protein n=1 Tax=Paracoccus sp. TaxID=267 RepID=UPI00391DC84B